MTIWNQARQAPPLSYKLRPVDKEESESPFDGWRTLLARKDTLAHTYDVYWRTSGPFICLLLHVRNTSVTYGVFVLNTEASVNLLERHTMRGTYGNPDIMQKLLTDWNKAEAKYFDDLTEMRRKQAYDEAMRVVEKLLGNS